MACLANSPGVDRWHVACYHRSLEPFMARGHELRAAGPEHTAHIQFVPPVSPEAGSFLLTIKWRAR